ncbi:MAG: TraR/DksA family transcriptional regulator [Solirubrobacteraceae bacterium]
MDAVDIPATERLLRGRLTELDERLALMEKPPERGSSVSFGKRVGDGTTEAIGRLTDVGVGESLESTRARIEAALARIAEGCYGICENCRRPIDPRRLHAAPESTLCIDCARIAQRR